jgi:NADPH2:quinone reductase
MALSIRIDRHGGPDVLQLVDVPVGNPGDGEIRIRHTAIGLNFIDTYHRSGVYPVPLPSGLGLEAAGVVTAIGENVRHLRPGDHVAYASGPIGAYCEERLMPAHRIVKLPDGIGDETAAALMLKGMTAYYLLHQTFAVRPGHWILVHAAAGGVGSLLVPWARHLGAHVIGTAGSPQKAALARSYGCHHVIEYREQEFAAETRRLTGGRGVDVVYDSVGKDTLPGSLDSLCKRGLLVSFGNASGKPPAIEPATLAAKGSLFLTRPALADYTSTLAELDQAASGLFEALARGIIKADICQRYGLRETARAHLELESRKTTGASLLIP